MFLLSCRRPPLLVSDPAAREQRQEELDDFHAAWLSPANQPPPGIDGEARAEVAEGTTVARVVRAELAPWNRAANGELRLLNDAAALLFEVEVRGLPGVSWVPEGTAVELNRPGTPIPAARQPDDVLLPLLLAAVDQERHGLTGDLVEHVRGAGAFRAAYLPLAPLPAGEDALVGLIAFPLPGDAPHIGAARLTLALRTASGVTRTTLTFD